MASAVLLALVCTPLFLQLGRWPLLEPDEGRNAEIAREMLTLGSWVVPTFDGLPFLDKPPVLFWSIAATFRAMGVNETAARMPSALAALVLVLLTFAMTRTLLDVRRGLVAATVTATAPLVLVFGRLTIFDMPFTMLVTLALFCLLQSRLHGRPRLWLPAAGLAMGLATLTKGPVGVAVPLLAWLAARGALPPPRARHGLVPVTVATAVFAGVIAPWLITVAVREPGFLRYAIVDETLLRFTSPARFNRAGPFYYATLMLGLGCGVWTMVLVGVGPALARRMREASPEAATIRFATRAVLAILLLFSLSASKRPGYVLPAVAPLAMLVAVGVTTAPRRTTQMVRLFALGAALVGALVMLVVIRDPAQPLASLWSNDVSPALTASVLWAAGAFLVTWGLVTVIGARTRPAVALVLAAAFCPALYGILLRPLDGYADHRSTRELARHIPPAAEVIAFRTFRTSLPFYLERPVTLVSDTSRELTSNYVLSRRDRFTSAPGLMEPHRLWEHLGRTPGVYVLASRSRERTVRRKSPRAVEQVYLDRRVILFETKE